LNKGQKTGLALALTALLFSLLYYETRPPDKLGHLETINSLRNARASLREIELEISNLQLTTSENYQPLFASLNALDLSIGELPSLVLSSLRRDVPSISEALVDCSEQLVEYHEYIGEFQRANSNLVAAVVNGDTLAKMQHFGELYELNHNIHTSELSTAIDDATLRYNQAFQSDLDTIERYRLILYAWMISLVIALITTIQRLRHLTTNQELLVKQRTMELDQALSELFGEMELAKKIQTALLPVSPSIRGCEVAASMEPAELVGGDYYDIITTPKGDWIIIGDVSGHGVSAGLIMMMAQTAVATAIKQDLSVTPPELLAVVNSTLIENIRRLGEQKYMTMSVVFRDLKGIFHFAGLHQDILVFRAASKEVESIATSGVWLGLVEELESSLPPGNFKLNKGDSLLLYTDGITESLTGDGEMLDTEGLAEILKSSHSLKTADEGLKFITNSVENREIDDDLTVILIRG
jgi:serine phosphatase RsbU (regulator of sigma subunit)